MVKVTPTDPVSRPPDASNVVTATGMVHRGVWNYGGRSLVTGRPTYFLRPRCASASRAKVRPAPGDELTCRECLSSAAADALQEEQDERARATGAPIGMPVR